MSVMSGRSVLYVFSALVLVFDLRALFGVETEAARLRDDAGVRVGVFVREGDLAGRGIVRVRVRLVCP
jgi:carotenoid cleavage dioxygenase-like enzyme